ncbi:alpha/beta hydrolase [Pseudorhodobacter sp. E13]|uniref:alpha/beta hydrolase n=1 Tax=Pseudorhodobacter sp. E13 TaxID=2487931 RepID=UPI0013151646|nr:alpha/beta hydrolase [Pseudorhodobacter sp. E13]
MTILRAFAALALGLLLLGCGPRSAIVVVPQTQGATVHEVLFATNRAPSAQLFGAERSAQVSYGAVRVSVPPAHEPGRVEYPGEAADPQKHFGIVDARRAAEGAGFGALLAQQLATRAAKERRVTIFVHGYNNSFAEALYMNTQIIHDYQTRDIPLLFSWPSAGENLGYLQDRDSVLFSRSAFETVLDQVQASGVESFTIVAHSIGSQLVMEVLRQHAIRNGGAQWGKLAGVVLVSPDIDVEMFEQQAADMGSLPQPFVVVGSRNDQLLRFSGVLNGNRLRLGTVEDTAVLTRAKAQVVSASFATRKLSANHTTAFSSPDMIALLRALESG